MWVWWVLLTGVALLVGRSGSTKVVAAVFFIVGVAFALTGPWDGISDAWPALF